MVKQFNKKFSIGTIEHILTFEPYCTGIKVVSLTDPDTEDVDEFEVEIPTIITRAMFDKPPLRELQIELLELLIQNRLLIY